MTDKNGNEKSKKILVVEDDPTVRTLVKAVLEHKGNDVTAVDNATDGESNALSGDFDIIILDLRLPDGNGYDVCANIREKSVTTPVLVLSAEHETDVKIKVLNVGADDYLTKPFNSEELLARIEAVTRRSNSDEGTKKLKCGDLSMDLVEREMKLGEHSIDLTNNEFNLMAYFIKNKNRVISQEELAENVWDIHFDTQTNYINVYISYIRKKLKEYSDEEYITTVRKKGFMVECNSQQNSE